MAKGGLDEKILQILRKDGRASNVEIAKAVGLTEGAVRHRLKNLVDNGTIKRFTVELSPGNEIFAIVMVKSKGETKKMMAEISGTGVPREAYEISGEYDGCIIISGKSMEEIDKGIDRIRKCNMVADTKTFMSFHRWQD